MSNTNIPPKEEDKRNIFERFIDNAAAKVGSALGSGTTAPVAVATGLVSGQVSRTLAAAGIEDNAIAKQITQTASDTLIEQQERANSAIMYPYRQYVARPLSTAFLAANKNYQEQGGSGFFDTDTWARGWQDAQQVSPGQALVGTIGSVVSGTQGTDKIDWSDPEQVNSYFSYGPQRWISFGLDATSSAFLDPYILAGKGAGAIVRKYGNAPVTSKNLPQVVKDIDDATTGGVVNDWTSTVDFYKRNINNDTALLAHPTIAGRPDLMRSISAAAKRSMETGNDSYIGEALKVAVGDAQAVDNAIYNSTYLASDLGVMTGERDLINKSIGIIRRGNTEMFNGFWTQNAPLAAQMVKSYRDKRSIIQERISEAQSEFDIIDRLAQQPVGQIQRISVSQFEKINQRRAQKAEDFASSYWHTEDVGNGARVLHYLEPSAMLFEKPSNYATLSPIANDRSHLEFAARLREWSKLTGRPLKVAKRYFEIYNRQGNKTDQWDMLESFNDKAMRDIVIARLKETGTITIDEQELVIKLAQHIAKNSRTHKSAVLEHVVDNNYTIHDKTGSQVFIKHMQDYEDAAAKEIAQRRAGKGAEVTEQDIIDAKKIVKDSLKNIQTGSSQIPNMHYSTDLVQFNNLISEHRYELRALIEESKRAVNEGINPEKIWDDIAGRKSKDLLQSEMVAAKARDTSKYVLDVTVSSLDSLYNNIWKPVTLASLHYTSRNVLEGQQRIVGVAFELSRDTGMPVTQILRDAYSTGVLERTFKNRAIKHEAKSAQKILNRARKEIVNQEYEYNTQLADSINASSDSFMSSLSESALEIDAMQQAYNRYTLPDGTPRKIKALDGYPQQILDHMKYHLDRIADVTSIPKGASEELYTAMANLDHTTTFDILASTDSKLTLTTLSEFQKRIRSEVDYIDNAMESDLYASLPTEMQRILSTSKEHLQNADLHIGSMTTLALAKASARGKLEELISKTDILNNIEKSASGEFEVIPGLQAPDAFAGVIGAIMRNESSAVLNSTRTVFNLDRVTTQSILNGRVKTGLVSPLETKANGVKVQNPGWAEIAADHANRRVRDASIQQLMKIDVNDPAAVSKVVKWAKGPTQEAKDWRALMRISIGELKGQQIKDPIRHIVERNRLFVEGHLPEVGIDGQVISPMLDEAGNFILDKDGNYVPGLRKKAIDGELTAEDMLSIPERQRTTTTGDILEEGNINRWKAFTTWMFKNIGSKPEDFFSRHPFYTMIYRSEYRRIASLWQKQGRSEQYLRANEEKLQQSAHKFAYKSLMEKMYSVERRTEPAEFMRFVSPFYMAKQNSNRFWIGYGLRNPQFFARYFLLYSAPGRVFDVENEEGKDVEGVNPFASAGASVMFTIPSSLAKALGIPEDARFRSQISSWDLINNGSIPFAPELGGPVFTRSAGWLFNKLSGTKYDPEGFLTTLGMDPKIIQKSILPFYQKQQQDSPRDALINAIVDVNSWMSSALKAMGGSDISVIRGIGELIEPGSKDAFSNRLIKNYLVLQEDFFKQQDPNVVLTSDEQAKSIAKLMSEAAGLTSNEFTLESFLSFAPTVGNAKLEDKAIRLSKELRQYQKEYGQDLGKTRYIQYLVEMGKTGPEAYQDVFIAGYKPRQQNEFGLVGTPQTVRNIMDNRDLFNRLSTMSKGKDNLADSKVLGALFNSGDPVTDYTQIANNKLFTEGVKKNYNDPKAVALDSAFESGSAKYFAVVDYYNALAAAQNPPIKRGSELYNQKYKPKIDEAEVLIGNQNPLWKREQEKIDTGGSTSNLKIIYTALSDEKFMNTVGKKNPLINSVNEYMKNRFDLVNRRMKLNNNENTNIYTSGDFVGVVADKEDLADRIIKKNPDFKQFYDYYLSRDQLLPIN